MSIGWGNPNNDIIARFREFTDGFSGLKLLYKFDEFMEDPKNKKSINNLAIYIENSINGLKYRSYSMSNADCGIQVDFDSTKYRGVSISVYLDFEKEKFFVSGGFYTDFGTRDEDYKEFSSNWEKIKLHKIGIETAKIYERIKDQYELLEESTMNYVGKTLRINESVYSIVSEGNNKVLCLSEMGEKFAIDKSDLRFSLLESGELNEASASISVVNKGVDKDGLLLVVNGANYHYTSKDYTPKQLEDKFVGIAKHSVGKAYAWIKKNAQSKESYKKEKPGMTADELEEFNDEFDDFCVDLLNNPENYFTGNESISVDREVAYRGTLGKTYTNFAVVSVYKWNEEESDDVTVAEVEMGVTVTGNAYPFKCEVYANSKIGGSSKKDFVLKDEDWLPVEKTLKKFFETYGKKVVKAVS